MTEREILEGLITAFESKDLEAVMRYFAEDAVLSVRHRRLTEQSDAVGVAAQRQSVTI
ncbi:MAG: hypothetical protein KC421_13600 [Anaerolineales bacterium]|nr:hypothetical protein [Anaerolineales bacterium]